MDFFFRVNLRHWALLSLSCSVILPPQKNVRKYLINHLKRCSSDYITEEGKYARFAEKVSFFFVCNLLPVVQDL